MTVRGFGKAVVIAMHKDHRLLPRCRRGAGGKDQRLQIRQGLCPGEGEMACGVGPRSAAAFDLPDRVVRRDRDGKPGEIQRFCPPRPIGDRRRIGGACGRDEQLLHARAHIRPCTCAGVVRINDREPALPAASGDGTRTGKGDKMAAGRCAHQGAFRSCRAYIRAAAPCPSSRMSRHGGFGPMRRRSAGLTATGASGPPAAVFAGLRRGHIGR